MNTFLPGTGTLLCGRSMVSQLALELSRSGARNPVVVHDGRFGRPARKVARLLAAGDFHSVQLVDSPDAAAAAGGDFLVAVGGGPLAEALDGTGLSLALVIPGTELLDGLDGNPAEILVIDSSMADSRGAAAGRFFGRLMSTATAGIIPAATDGPDIPKAFTWSNPTKAIAGSGSLSELTRLIAEAGMARPLVLTDRGLRDVGLLARLEAVLEGLDIYVFDDIPPDSDTRTVEGIREVYFRENRDGIIAFGGGSVLDTGKGVFLAVSDPSRSLGDWAGADRVPRLEIPFIAVPTTSGTGSEATKAAVVADVDMGRKVIYISPNLQPGTAVLDGELTAGLPPYLTSITGMDALSHAVEAYTCLGKNPLSDMAAVAAIRRIRDNLVPLMDDPGNQGMRQEMVTASFLAGQAFSNSMVGMVHAIGHSVGAACHVPHGACMAVLLPLSLEYNLREIEGLLAGLYGVLVHDSDAGSHAPGDPASGVSRTAGQARTPGQSLPPGQAALAVIEKVKEMNAALREKTGGRHPERLSHLLENKDRFEDIARLSLGDGAIVYNPRELRYRDVLDVLETAW